MPHFSGTQVEMKVLRARKVSVWPMKKIGQLPCRKLGLHWVRFSGPSAGGVCTSILNPNVVRLALASVDKPENDRPAPIPKPRAPLGTLFRPLSGWSVRSHSSQRDKVRAPFLGMWGVQ